MQAIGFNEHYGLQTAVFERRKTMTRRAEKGFENLEEGNFCFQKDRNQVVLYGEKGTPIEIIKLRYKIGEIVAIKQCYKDIIDQLDNIQRMYVIGFYSGSKAWTNKMFVRADLMPRHIRITDVELQKRTIVLKETGAILRYSGGDARKLLNIVELVVEAANEGETVEITDELVENRLQQNPLAYDKDGEMHYDIISAFIKSIRGSDPDAALYWMARMIEGGEDPQFIARRMVISASEDIGLANPNALLLANATFDAVMKIGWPEGRIPLAECAVYLACSPKSNSSYLGIGRALDLVRKTGNQPVPLHLRNAPTKLMADLGYSDGYKYAHDYPGNFVRQQFLPDQLADERLWEAQHTPSEEKLYQRMLQCWGERFSQGADPSLKGGM